MIRADPPQSVIHSIGHSNHPIDRFLALLAGHGITQLADIRSMPASRHHPQFNKKRLAEALATKGIGYVFLGRELGGSPRDPACYEDGVVSFARIAATPAFHDGLDRLIALATGNAVVMMCAERDPPDCHRTHLVAPALTQRGWAVLHILADGSVVSHAELRSAGAAPSVQPDLFDRR